MIDIKDYTDLAYYYANKSNKRFLQGVELDDLYQVSMIGIWNASILYEEDRGAFSTFAHRFIEGEINNLVYKSVSRGGVRGREPRITEELISDIMTDDGQDYIDSNSYEDSCFDDISLDELLTKVSLLSNERLFLSDMIRYGDTEATALYMTQHGCTRQRANQIKKLVREKAQKYMRREI